MVRTILPVIVALAGTACAGQTAPINVAAPAQVELSQLWQEPVDLAERDLFYGSGGSTLAPDPSATFEFIESSSGGYSPGYDVRGPDGTEWSVKLGPEAQPEIAVSRILWALGYHQPPAYYLERWTLTGKESGTRGPARFRPKLPDRKAVADWSWYENPFVGTQPFQGLLVANLLLNNWDWKTSNNKIYDVTGNGAPSRVYIVQDLGASLGKTSFPKWLNFAPMRGLGQGSRNDLEDFESQGFIKGVEGDRVNFHYRGIHGELVKTVTVRDVVWTSERLARISDAQMADAFRAAGYSTEQTQRFVTKIRGKIAAGLALSRS